eukprot:TRINITY_DN14676_c0_g1_i1.p1 TRINITY_DN14676_c0_g1~~TRINITY_DN14676_c0_g1_i1.p1  ORF type:complete len:284 (-),score=50.49 TRINITY_DN14676_c0_g1_i1:75-926(-)
MMEETQRSMRVTGQHTAAADLTRIHARHQKKKNSVVEVAAQDYNEAMAHYHSQLLSGATFRPTISKVKGIGTWEGDKVRIAETKGTLFQTMGFTLPPHHYYTAVEALYLSETGRLGVELHGEILPIQALYSLLSPADIQVYPIYKRLQQDNYIIRETLFYSPQPHLTPATAITSTTTTATTAISTTADIPLPAAAAVPCTPTHTCTGELRVRFDVWHQEKRTFSKKRAGPPKFRVVVHRPQGAAVCMTCVRSLISQSHPVPLMLASAQPVTLAALSLHTQTSE